MAVPKLKASKILRNIRDECENNIKRGQHSDFNKVSGNQLVAYTTKKGYFFVSEQDRDSLKEGLEASLKQPLKEMKKYYKEQDALSRKKKDAYDVFNNLFNYIDKEDIACSLVLKADYQPIVKAVLQQSDIHRSFLIEHLVTDQTFYKALLIKVALPLYSAGGVRIDSALELLKKTLCNSFRDTFICDAIDLKNSNSKKVKIQLLYEWKAIFNVFKSCNLLSPILSLLNLCEKSCDKLILKIANTEGSLFSVDLNVDLPFEKCIKELESKENAEEIQYDRREFVMCSMQE